MFFLLHLLGAAVCPFALAQASETATRRYTGGACKCFPGDACWPAEDEWGRLNNTVSGRLVATRPLASPCHDPYFDEAKCAAVRKEWFFPTIQ